MRQRLALAAVLAAGLAAGVVLGTSGSALAFPHICSGTACHGSGSDSFGDVCTPGTTTYWEDSYLPATAIAPHVTSFEVTPNPPCTGANVSEPKAEPWPASKTDPDGKPVAPKPGEATLRITWTVFVPQGSKSLGSMNVAWSVAWTEPSSGGGGRTETVTTTRNESARYDLEVQVTAPDSFAEARAPQRIAVKVDVFDNGPAESPELTGMRNLVVKATVSGDSPWLRVVAVPANCKHFSYEAQCDVKALRPHGEESFAMTFLYTTRVRKAVLARQREGKQPGILFEAFVYLFGGCKDEETNCDNNSVREEVPGRR